MNTRITIKDVSALNLWVNVTSPANYLSLAAAGILIFWFTALPKVSIDSVYISILISVAAFGAGAFIAIIVSLPIFVIVISSNFFIKGGLGDKSYSIEESSLLEKDRYKENSYEFTKIKGVYLTKNYIYLKISIFKWLIIPRRDFAKEIDFYKYYLEIDGKCK